MRDISTQLQNLNHIGSYPIQLVKIQVDKTASNDLNLTTCYRNVDHNSETYTASSNLLELSAVEETTDVKTNAITVRLNTLPAIILPKLASVNAIGGQVTIFQGFYDETLGNTTGLVYEKWKGVINSHTVDEDNSQGNVTISLECKNVIGTILNTKAGRFTSDTSIQEHNTGDRSAEYVASLVDFNPFFGREE